MKAMNIGLLHYSAPPVVGGVESILGQHARLMADGGQSVHMIAGRGQAFDDRIVFHKIPLVDSMHPEVLSVKGELDQGVVSARFDALVSEMSLALDPILDDLNVLVAHNVCSLHKNLALTAALWKRTQKNRHPRMILWHHDLAWTALRYRNELHDGYPWDLIRQDWPGAIPIVVSEFRRVELTALTGRNSEQIKVVPNGVSISRLLALDSQTSKLVRRLNLLGSAPFILLPVRITRRKNIELAVRVLAELRKHYPDATLVITGPPGPHNPSNQEYFTELKELRHQLSLDNCVHFLAEIVPEYLPDDVIFGLFRLADLLLLPSYEEGFGLPIIEASQVNLPIFCSDIAPLRELAGDQAAYFSPEASAQEVALKIRQALSAGGTDSLKIRLRALDWNRLYTERIWPLIRDVGEEK